MGAPCHNSCWAQSAGTSAHTHTCNMSRKRGGGGMMVKLGTRRDGRHGNVSSEANLKLDNEGGGRQSARQQSAPLQSLPGEFAGVVKDSFQGGHPGGVLSGPLLDWVTQNQRLPASGRQERRMVAKMRWRQKTGLDSVMPFSGYTHSKFSRQFEIITPMWRHMPK
jgi:hypothetical protein